MAENGAYTELDPLIRHAAARNSADVVPLPGDCGHRWLRHGLLVGDEGSSERSANLSGVSVPVKPGFPTPSVVWRAVKSNSYSALLPTLESKYFLGSERPRTGSGFDDDQVASLLPAPQHRETIVKERSRARRPRSPSSWASLT